MPKKKLNLSTQTASLPNREKRDVSLIDVSAFLDSLSRFTEENFSAAAKIEVPEPICGTSPLSLEGSALFWKLLLGAVMGKHFITARADAKSGVLTLSFTAPGGIFLESGECIKLMESANTAGFTPRFEEGEIILKAKIRLSHFSTIYARDLEKDAFYYALCKRFFE